MTDSSLQKSSRCWGILVGCCIMCGIGFGIPMTTMSAFMKPMIVSMGSTATGVTLYFTILALASIPCVIIGPRFLKKNAAATVAVAGAVSGAAIVLISMVPSVPIVWAAAVLVGLTYPMCSTLAAPVLISNWFRKGTGTFMGVSMAFTGVGSAFLVPVMTGFIESMGWQAAMRGMGIVYIVIVVLVGIFLIRFDPIQMGLLPFGVTDENASADAIAGENNSLPGIAYKEMFKTIPFWIMAACLLLVGFTGCINTQINTIAQLSGFTAVVAGFIVTGMSIGNVIGKIALGALKDKFSGAVAGLFGVIVAVIGVALFLFGIIGGAGDGVMIAGGFICGLGSCLGTMAGPLFVLDTFGPREYGNILGTMSVFTTVGLALGAPIVSSFYDIGGSYVGALICIMICFVLIVPCVFAAVKMGQKLWNEKQAK